MEEKELEEEFWKTVKSGMFWEWFPELSGVWEKDKEEYIATKKRWSKIFSERRKLDETPVVQGDAYVSGGVNPLNSGSSGEFLIVSNNEVSYSNKKTGYERLPFPELVDELAQYYKHKEYIPLKQRIMDAHMAGQADAGISPSHYDALVYYENLDL